MNIFKSISLILILLLLVPSVQAESIEWHMYEEGMALANEENKPVMIDFYADRCGWCVKLDDETYMDPEVIATSKEFVNIKVDTDVDYKLTLVYGVENLPTIVFTNPNGEEMYRVVGFRDGDIFNKIMKAVISGEKPPEPQTPGFETLLGLSALAIVWLVRSKYT
ncbi:MAG: thioredoxin domain-containing protein [Halobacteriota archaeon]|nr:thioredoxin domain-containing protein [Halobacteriota archaeon]